MKLLKHKEHAQKTSKGNKKLSKGREEEGNFVFKSTYQLYGEIAAI